MDIWKCIKLCLPHGPITEARLVSRPSTAALCHLPTVPLNSATKDTILFTDKKLWDIIMYRRDKTSNRTDYKMPVIVSRLWTTSQHVKAFLISARSRNCDQGNTAWFKYFFGLYNRDLGSPVKSGTKPSIGLGTKSPKKLNNFLNEN